MNWYLYAFAAGDCADLPPGIGGRPVLVRAHRGVWLLASDWQEGAPRPSTTADILAHEGVVEAAMAQCAILPCRFGTILPDPVCRDFVDKHVQMIGTRLQQVSGQVEVSLKLFHRAGAGPARIEAPLRSATGYLQAIQRAVHREQERVEQVRRLAGQIDAVFAPWTTRQHLRLQPAGGAVAAITYLIPKRHLQAWADAAAGLRQRFADYDFLATGPWPPYHFSEVMSHSGGAAEPCAGGAGKP